MTRVKICGVNSAVAMDAAVAAGADWVGFVFARSPRRVSPAEAAALSARHDGGPLRVGLFVDPSEDEIDAALEAVPLDVLQLYADVDRVAALRAVFGITVWRAVGVGNAADLPDADEAVDGYVVDAKPGPERPGGNGVGFDWALTRAWSSPRPWLLAGGLTPANVAAAVAASGAAAVDVSSGVETAPGVKDPALIAEFVSLARQTRSRD